jgi:hypothetical protein
VPLPGSGQILWRGDYSTGTFSQWVSHQWSRNNDQGTPTSQVGDSSAVLVTSPVRALTDATQFTIYGGSALAGDNTARAEVSSDGSAAGSYNGQTWYYAWSTYIPAESWPNWSGNWNVITTLGHGTPNGYPIPLSIGVDATGATPHLYAEDQNLAGNDVNVTNIGDLSTVGWIDFVARVDWTTSTNGRVQLWRNGVLVFDVAGIQSLNSANADGSSYWKQGVYVGHPGSSAPWPTNLSVFHACARRGDSYAAVTATTC